MHSIDLSKHYKLQESGHLYIQEHRDLPLLIHNYAPKTQYERYWNEVTLRSRGLITDLEGRILARPFPKFFNLDEHISTIGPLPAEPFEVFEKMDGSLGILYHFEGKPGIATRGSFHSEQSERAHFILQHKYPQVEFNPQITYLFEIIYPENRIVVQYGDMEDLVLLGMIETSTGRELPLQNIGLPLVKQYERIKGLDQLRQLEEPNREGFVIRFSGGLRVKVKFEEYVRLHKILTGVTKRTIWEYMRDGHSMDDLLDKVPDEFYQWVKEVKSEVNARFREIEEVCKREYRTFATRKEAAEYFQTCTYPMILFRMLDGRNYDDIIWKLIYPEHSKPFSEEVEKKEEVEKPGEMEEEKGAHLE